MSQNEEEFQSECFLNASLDPIYIYLSTDSIIPLLQIFKGNSSESEISPESEDDDHQENPFMSRSEYKNLMECIDYDTSKPMDNITTRFFFPL